ncbi:Reverse transcriptase [Phytophthora palmivora]|uniref:Reverse transcriptase n=1 Tax=Phytophthora palmivora TaxID=4796 RepID=A0A2P4XXG1_9STRA|nr:Reverse transcriptase [Phytophthora palmivora]
MQGPRVNAVSTTSVETALILAQPRVSTYEARLEPKRGQPGLHPKNDAATVKINAVTRSHKTCRPQVLQEAIVQRMRMECISRAQDEEKWIVNLNAYLRGGVQDLTSTEAKNCSKIADRFETDESGLLFYFPPTKQSDEDRDIVAKLVVPETLQNNLMHHYHTSLKGGHQGIGRTYHKIRAHFHWPGLYQSVQRYVGQCIDCETGKGRPTIHGESPGNLQATYPFQIIGMDHIPSLPRSHKGNTELLIWIDLFTGYVIAKASSSRAAQTVAENYDECVFRRFGASEAIRHD